ncbi:hypothetical protein CDL12_23752 [Handroanthus impetiginosus]|uniref:Uncharacterized protein n=1 Tax=Handroanthus impetiginosus TaxID=429701 RepID=A0A2G9GEK0_9LAMI|nr:hypothetical protein CDL12_23752 [Handroanthus impetiginosus]
MVVRNISVLLLIYLLIFELGCPEIIAIRPLDAAEQRQRGQNLVVQSLPRGLVLPSRGRCALAVHGGDFSGEPMAAFPPAVVRFGLAS